MSHSRDENNSDSESIKSTDSKIGLKFLEYDSDEENSPPLQSQTGEDEPKPEEEGIGDMARKKRKIKNTEITIYIVRIVVFLMKHIWLNVSNVKNGFVMEN